MKQLRKIGNMTLGWIKRNYTLLLIVAVGGILRFYRLQDFFVYGHDQDLASWFVKDVVENNHLRLIGQETSTQGIFIGPLWYYLLIPFYLLFGMDPLGGEIYVIIIGILTIISFYYAFSQSHDKPTGLIAALIYAVSFPFVFNDKEMVPTMPVFLWSVWFYYATVMSLRKKYYISLPLWGLLLGLVWHMNFALILLFPLIPLTLFFSKNTFRFKQLILSLGIFSLMVLPFLVFELKHGFIQERSFLAAITTDQYDIVKGISKWNKVVDTLAYITNNIFIGYLNTLNYRSILYLFFVLFVILIYRKVISFKLAATYILWLALYLVFFTAYSKRVSEYYLNGTIILFIGTAALSLRKLLTKPKYKYISYIVLLTISANNIYRIITAIPHGNGYLQRKAIVQEIKADSQKQGYPCISISYIVDPGYELGYRYLFWLEKLSLRKVSSGSPVYTVVFPQKSIFKEDVSFGGTGLIYPEYNKYTKKSVTESCLGEDVNSTEPMYGMPN